MSSEILDQAAPGEYKEDQEVQLLIVAETDLGFTAIVNDKHWALLYHNEIFQKLQKNQQIKGFIKKIREDGRLDVSLYKTGHRGADDIGPRILEALESNDGFLQITDKTPPEIIYDRFGVSKKKFKIAVGGLYKARKILVEDGGLRLVAKVKSKIRDWDDG